jgi:hypothetical protein
MNNQEKYKEDLLRQYINSENTEEAPEGFTSKVMTRIQLETQLLTSPERSQKRNLIPVIFAIVTILLIVTACLIPGSSSDPLTLPILNLIRSTKSVLPEINLSSVLKLTLPSVMMYVFIGIVVLTFFDRALYVIFHREK